MAGDYKLRRTSSEGSHAIKFLLQSTSKIAAARTTKIEPEKENSESSELPQNLKGVSSRALNFLKGIETSDSHIPGICGPCKLFTVWENDYSIKILGSRNAIEKEELRRKNLPMFTIHPFSRAKLVDVPQSLHGVVGSSNVGLCVCVCGGGGGGGKE